MALTSSRIAGNQSTTSGASLTATGVTAAIGDWLIVIVGADNAGTGGTASITSSSITDDAGNTYTNRGGITVRDQSGVNTGCVLACYTAPVTNTTSSATVTCAFSPNTTSKGMIVLKAVPDSGYTVAYRDAGTGQTGQSTSAAASTVNVTLGDTIYGFACIEGFTDGFWDTGDSDSTNGAWSAVYRASATTGSAGTSIAVKTQWKEPSATGNQTYDSITGVTVDWAINYLILGQDPDVPPEIIGTFSVTDETDSVTSDSIIVLGAVASITDNSDTMSADGSFSIAAALSLTDETDVVSSSGALDIAGAAAITDADDAVVSTGGVYIILALFEVTDETDVVTSAGVLPLVAALSLTDATDVLTSASIIPLLGDSAMTDAADSVTSFGASNNFGDLGITDDTDTLTSAGVLPILAALTLTDDPDLLFATNVTARGRSVGYFL